MEAKFFSGEQQPRVAGGLAAPGNYSTVVSLALIALAIMTPRLSDAATFGTGVGFDGGFYSGFTGVTEQVALQQIVNGRGEVDVTHNTAFGDARARAKTLPNEFSLGVSADGLGTFNRSAWAFASTAFNLTGDPGNIFLNFTIEGDIPLAAARQTGSFAFWVHGLNDNNGGPLGRIDGALQENGSRFLVIDHNTADPASIVDTNAGSHFVAGLRVLVPEGTTGIIAMMLASSNGAKVDFLGTATLTSAELPPGATLTLDTGQVVPVVPEPATLALFMTAAAATHFSTRRRAAA